MPPKTRESLLRELATSLRRCADIADTLVRRESEPVAERVPRGQQVWTIEQIDAAVLQHGGVVAAARALGTSKETLQRRLKAAYGPPTGDSAATGALLKRLIQELGYDTVAKELGSTEAVIARWSYRKRIPSTVCRAIQRVAEKHLS